MIEVEVEVLLEGTEIEEDGVIETLSGEMTWDATSATMVETMTWAGGIEI